MNGRVSLNNKIAKEIEDKLNNYPDFLCDFYYGLRASNKQITSCREYLNKAINFLESIDSDVNNINPENITRQNVNKYMIGIQTKTDNKGNIKETSDSYQLSVWYALRSFFDYLKRNEYIKENYMLNIDKPKNRDLARINSKRLLLTERDFVKILNSVESGVGDYIAKSRQIKERDMAIMVLLMTTGMRRTALTTINIDDIDFDTQTLKVIDKGNKFQEYYLSDEVIYIIQKWIDKRSTLPTIKDENALFISRQGNRCSGHTIFYLVEKYCEDALGYKVSPHKIRAGFCSQMYEATGDIEKVRRMVGHSDVSTTQRYIVTENKERIESAQLMAAKLRL